MDNHSKRPDVGCVGVRQVRFSWVRDKAVDYLRSDVTGGKDDALENGGIGDGLGDSEIADFNPDWGQTLEEDVL